MKYLALILILWAGPAWADEKIDCTAPGSTGEENQCADEAFQKADKEMNAVWPKLVASAEQSDLNDDATRKHHYKKMVIAAQRAWLAYRDADCQLGEFIMEGGSGSGPIIGNCRAYLTEERVKKLKDLLPK